MFAVFMRRFTSGGFLAGAFLVTAVQGADFADTAAPVRQMHAKTSEDATPNSEKKMLQDNDKIVMHATADSARALGHHHDEVNVPLGPLKIVASDQANDTSAIPVTRNFENRCNLEVVSVAQKDELRNRDRTTERKQVSVTELTREDQAETRAALPDSFEKRSYPFNK